MTNPEDTETPREIPKRPTPKQTLARELNWTKSQIINAASLLKRQGLGVAAMRAIEFAEAAALMQLQRKANDAGISGNYLQLLPYEMTRYGKHYLKHIEEYKKEQAKTGLPF